MNEYTHIYIYIYIYICFYLTIYVATSMISGFSMDRKFTFTVTSTYKNKPCLKILHLAGVIATAVSKIHNESNK